MTFSTSQPTRLESLPTHQPLANLQATTGDAAWTGLFKAGAVAAWIAALVFRRNLGSEWMLLRSLGIITAGPMTSPQSVLDWFGLLHTAPLLGLTLLNLFDMVNYALVGVICLALCVALWRANQSAVIIAAGLSLMGIAVYLTSNQALTLLSLGDQYAAAATDAQRSLLLAAGQAVLAIHQNAGYEGNGLYLSFCLISLAGFIMSVVMRRSKLFSPATAYLGLLANGFGLAYYLALALTPALIAMPLSISAVFLLAWYVLIGRQLWTNRLIQLGA